MQCYHNLVTPNIDFDTYTWRAARRSYIMRRVGETHAYVSTYVLVCPARVFGASVASPCVRVRARHDAQPRAECTHTKYVPVSSRTHVAREIIPMSVRFMHGGCRRRVCAPRASNSCTYTTLLYRRKFTLPLRPVSYATTPFETRIECYRNTAIRRPSVRTRRRNNADSAREPKWLGGISEKNTISTNDVV